MKRKLTALSFLLFGLLLVLAACGDESDTATNDTANSDSTDTPATEEAKTFTIGTTQIVEHPSLDAATEGFKAAIEDAGIKANYIDKSANNDTQYKHDNCTTISK